MYIHLLHDNLYVDKFIKFVKWRISNNNFKSQMFIILGKGTYIDDELKAESNIIFINEENIFKRLRTITKLVNKYSKMTNKFFLHYLDLYDYVLVLSNREISKKAWWIVWGGDIYYNFDNRKFLKRIFYKMLKKKAVKKIPHVCGLVKGDFDILKKQVGELESEWHHVFYPNPVDFDLLDRYYLINSSFENRSINILVGNSADPSNNHIEVLDYLGNLSFKGKVYCPLSYGEKEYAEEVCKYGDKILKDKFEPMMDFLKPEEYSQFLSKIDIAIFNHKRQQGLGNILALLYLGKKVYIRSETTSWSFFDDLGIEIYDTVKLLKNGSTPFEPISFEKAKKNREIIAKEFSEERAIELWKKIFNA